MLDREVRRITQGYGTNGAAQDINQDTVYDNVGRVAARSRPYFAGSTAAWVRYSYDEYDRVIQELRADGGTTKSYYDPDTNGQKLTREVSNDGTSTQFTVEYRNWRGDLTQVTDALGSKMYLQHDAFGNPRKRADLRSAIEKASESMSEIRTELAPELKRLCCWQWMAMVSTPSDRHWLVRIKSLHN